MTDWFHIFCISFILVCFSFDVTDSDNLIFHQGSEVLQEKKSNNFHSHVKIQFLDEVFSVPWQIFCQNYMKPDEESISFIISYCFREVILQHYFR